MPADLAVSVVPKLKLFSEEPVDVRLYDAARQEVAAWPSARKVEIGFARGETVYLRVSGPTHTRYRLWIGTQLSPAFGRKWEEVHILPKWLEVDVHPDWVVDPVEYRGLVVDELAVNDGVLGFGDISSAALPEHVRLELLDEDGASVRQAEIIDGVTSFAVAGLDPGTYVVRIESEATADRPIGLLSVAPPALR